MAFAPSFVDLVRNYTTTSGTDDFLLGAAVNGFASFTDVLQAGDGFYYSATGIDNPGDTEVGRGTLLAGGTISRDPISGKKTNFKSGTKSIALVTAAEWFSEVDAARAGTGPTNVKSFGAKGDGVSDDTAALQAALDHMKSIGGGTLYIPEGVFIHSAALTVPANTTIRGAGMMATTLQSAHAGGGGATAGESLRNGSGLVTVSPINGSTGIRVVIEDIRIANSNAANAGAAYYDTGGTYILCRNAGFGGFKFGIVLEQSELVDIDLCSFGGQKDGGGGVWIVNGAELTPGASGGYCNRIAIKRCQFDQSPSAYGVIDDGGNAHAIDDCNFNGCLNHIRAAGVYPLLLRGGEFESAASHCVLLVSTKLSGETAGGGCDTAVIGGFYAATPGHASFCGQAGGGGRLSISAMTFLSGGAGTHPITGAGSFACLYLSDYRNMSTCPTIVDGNATYVNVDIANPQLGPTIEGVTLNDGTVTASNIGTAAALSTEAVLQSANNLAELTDKVAAAKNLGSAVVLAQAAVGVSHTGDTSPFTFASVTLPANAMGANGQLVIEALFSMNNSGNSKEVQILLGGQAMTDLSISSQLGTQVHSRVANRNSAGSQVAQNIGITGYGNNNPRSYSIDTTIDQTISLVGTLANAADTVALESYQILLYPKD